MNTRMVVPIILLLTAAIVSATVRTDNPARPLSPFEQTLMATEKAFLEALKKGDSSYFKRTLADDFSYVGFDGQLANRQQMIDERGDPGFDVLPYNMKVFAIGEDAGIVTYDVVLRVPPSEDQGPPPRYQHFSTVWVKQGGTWKMKFHQMTSSHWGDW